MSREYHLKNGKTEIRFSIPDTIQVKLVKGQLSEQPILSISGLDASEVLGQVDAITALLRAKDILKKVIERPYTLNNLHYVQIVISALDTTLELIESS